MSDELGEIKRTPAKPEDLDFEQLAAENTKAPEKVTKRLPDAQPIKPQDVADATTEEMDDLADDSEADSETEAPGARPPSKQAPLAQALLAHPELLDDADRVPDHAGQREAATDRLLAGIVYHAAARLEYLMAHLGELPLIEQAKVMTMMKDLLVQMHDIHITRIWTKRLQKVILERFTLLQQTKSNGLRKVAGYAAQAAKELKTDGRTTAGRNKKAAGRLPAADLPTADEA